MAAATSSTASIDDDNTPLPSWLANHLNIEWSSDDVDALLTSIEASQDAKPPTLPHLPAELLILIIKYVPIAFILDWRLVCRSFRDAIDGPVLYYHLQRTQLIGYLGPKTSPHMWALSDNEYERLHLVPARFQAIGNVVSTSSQPAARQLARPVWRNSHAVFKMRPEWWEKHELYNNRLRFPSKSSMLSQITLCRTDLGYGTLSWAIQLDTGVLDLDLPLEPTRRSFDVKIESSTQTVEVEWKPMLFQFFKTERALRLLTEQKHVSPFTFSRTEDCLRAVRRQRLHAALDPDSKIDRHIKWSLRLLQPLWGVGGHRDFSTLDFIEADAINVLLLLRREAVLSNLQVEHLHDLDRDYRSMLRTMDKLSRLLRDLKQEMILPGHATFIEVEVRQDCEKVPVNPIAWSDELRTNIESRVQKWRSQGKLIDQMQASMIALQEASAVPEDAFDGIDSEF